MSSDWDVAFERLVSRHDYPMYVVTASAGGERDGCLVGFATQCSIDPPRLLVCLSKENRTYRTAQRAGSLVVHFLSTGDEPLARLFGEQTGDDVDKLAQCSWRPSADGTPVLDGCRGWATGEVLTRTDVGDHVGYLLQISDAETRDDGSPPFGYQLARNFRPGHPA
jgi:flavin reductase (DIM6/NTAB) family NADH-FMN oxidoreductase RutF